MTKTEKFAIKCVAASVVAAAGEIASGVIIGRKVKKITNSSIVSVAAGFGATVVTSKVVDVITVPMVKKNFIEAMRADADAGGFSEDFINEFEYILGTPYEDIEK